MILVTVINNLNMITKIQTNLLLLNNEIFKKGLMLFNFILFYNLLKKIVLIFFQLFFFMHIKIKYKLILIFLISLFLAFISLFNQNNFYKSKNFIFNHKKEKYNLKFIYQ